MKSVVLLCTNLIFHCIAAKSFEVAGYFQKQGTNFGWTGCTKHSITVLFVICAGILYYVPQSRYYAQKGSRLMIELAFGILKTTFSHAWGIFVPKETGNDHSSYHVRKHHPNEQGPKTGDDDSRGRERKQHRHRERSRHNRERKYAQPGQRVAQGQRFESTSKHTEGECFVAHPVQFYAEQKMDNCGYTGARKGVLEKEKRSNVRECEFENASNHPERECDAEFVIRQRNFGDHEREARVAESAVMFSSEERDCAIRAEDASFTVQKLNVQKKAGDFNTWKEADSNDSALVVENEEVLAQLEEQIMMLEKTIKAMQPGIGEQKIHVIDDILGQMKRSYGKIYAQMHHRRMASPKTERAKNPTSGTAYLPRNEAHVESDTDHLGSAAGARRLKNEHSFSIHGNPKELTSDKNVKLSNRFLEDNDELPPIITNRIKPYLIRTFNWFFTGCPEARKHNVGKDGGGSFTAEPSL